MIVKEKPHFHILQNTGKPQTDNLTLKRYSQATLQTHKEKVCRRYSYTNMNRLANYVNSIAARVITFMHWER